jgi:hypothetical protein
MGVRNFAAMPKPEPKESCSSCGRPLAILKTGQCVYCGTKVPGLTVVKSPDQLQLAKASALLEPRPHENTKQRWLIRIAASVVGSGVLALIVRSCMKSG